MLRAARADPHTRHLTRFILIAVYTGTRKQDILRLEFTPSLTGGHFDLERGVLHRKSIAARQTKKRGTPAKLPRQLLAHARRWERLSVCYAVEYAGRPVKDVKRAWASVAARAGVVGTSPHAAKHTAITWAMQWGAKLPDAAAFFGTSIQTIESTYFHHHPDFQKSAVAALEKQ
jgi:integrase